MKTYNNNLNNIIIMMISISSSQYHVRKCDTQKWLEREIAKKTFWLSKWWIWIVLYQNFSCYYLLTLLMWSNILNFKGIHGWYFWRCPWPGWSLVSLWLTTSGFASVWSPSCSAARGRQWADSRPPDESDYCIFVNTVNLPQHGIKLVSHRTDVLLIEFHSLHLRCLCTEAEASLQTLSFIFVFLL